MVGLVTFDSDDSYDSDDDSPLLDVWGIPIPEETINRFQEKLADLNQARIDFFNPHLRPGDLKIDRYGFFGTEPYRRPPNK